MDSLKMNILRSKGIILLLCLFSFILGSVSGYSFLYSRLSNIERQKVNILSVSQGDKTILEALVDVEKVCSEMIEQIPYQYDMYTAEDKQIVKEIDVFLEGYFKDKELLDDLKNRFFSLNDPIKKAEIGFNVFSKMNDMNEKLVSLREIEKKRLEISFKYSNYLYSSIEDMLYAYGFHKLR